MPASRPIPAPPGWPLVGNLLQVPRGRPTQHFTALARSYGEIFSINFAGHVLPFVCSAALVAEVCNEKRFRKLVETLPSSIVFVLDPDLCITYAGGSMIASPTFRPATYIGRTVRDITAPAVYATLEPYLQATLQGQETSFELTSSRGTIFQTCTAPLEDEGSVQEILVVALDVTAQKRAEAALRAELAERKLRELEHEELLRQIEDKAHQLAQVMESAPAGVLLLDTLNRVILNNRRAADKLALLAT